MVYSTDRTGECNAKNRLPSFVSTTALFLALIILLAACSPSATQSRSEAQPDVLIADHLFLLYDSNADAKEGFKQLKQSKVFQSLPPVKNGKIHYIPLEYKRPTGILVNVRSNGCPSPDVRRPGISYS